MFGTLIAVVFAVVIEYLNFLNYTPNFTMLTPLFLTVGITFLVMHSLIYAFAFGPLQQSEHTLTPRVLELLRKDSRLGYIKLWLLIFPLASFVLAFYPSLLESRPLGLALWIIALGIACDALNSLYKRIIDYFNPYAITTLFTKEANHCIQDDREVDLCHWIDALGEIATKAVQGGSTSLANHALTEMQQIARLFLEASKSIGHQTHDKQMNELGVQDKVSYTMFYLFQRLELVNHRASEKRLQPTCNHLITLLGKIAVDSAKYDISMALYPLHYLGKFTKEALAHQLFEVGDTATCTLLGVSKEILELDITYLEIRDPFLSIINTLEVIAQETFKRDKTINLKVVTQPLEDLKVLFTTEKLANHADTPIILQNIDRVLGEFATLEMVLRTIPKIPDVSSP